jgi:hypothetical protein
MTDQGNSGSSVVGLLAEMLVALTAVPASSRDQTQVSGQRVSPVAMNLRMRRVRMTGRVMGASPFCVFIGTGIHF